MNISDVRHIFPDRFDFENMTYLLFFLQEYIINSKAQLQGDAMGQEYEVISHGELNFRLFLVNMLYRTPHIHKDFELCLIMEGSICVTISNNSYQLGKGDLVIINPFQSHELKAGKPALILSIQINTTFFSACCPQMANLEFLSQILFCSESEQKCSRMRSDMLEIADLYFSKADKFELKCAGLLNLLFASLLEVLPYRVVTDRERSASKQQASRMREITHYIDEHYSEKLLLSDIADDRGLSLTYLSHFFKEHLGISFQEYLLRIRCEKARQLLLMTGDSLLDISIACGFSDPKYFNADFKRQYDCRPKEYRRTYHNDSQQSEQISILSAQEFLSPEAALIIARGRTVFVPDIRK